MLSKISRILIKSSQGFYHNDGFLLAKSLSFQTLFCLLPSLLLLFFITSALGVFQSPLIQIEYFITDTFVPKPLREELINQANIAFQHSQSIFTIVLLIFLLATFSLFTDMHDVFFKLSYKTKKQKIGLLNQMYTYFMLLLGSLLMLVIDFNLGSIMISKDGVTEIPHFLIKVLSFSFTAFLIYGTYNIMSPVKLYKSHMGVISVLLSMLLLGGQKLFIIYLSWFPGYMLVYGAIAILPLLFVWVYLHWVILLYGYTLLIECSSLKNLKKKELENLHKIES